VAPCLTHSSTCSSINPIPRLLTIGEATGPGLTAAKPALHQVSSDPQSIYIPGGERWPRPPGPCGQRNAHQSGENDRARTEVANDGRGTGNPDSHFPQMQHGMPKLYLNVIVNCQRCQVVIGIYEHTGNWDCVVLSVGKVSGVSGEVPLHELQNVFGNAMYQHQVWVF
jgi:hypothetical protein